MPRFAFIDGYSLPANEGDILPIGTRNYYIQQGQLICVVPQTSDDWHDIGMHVEVGRDHTGRPMYEHRDLVAPEAQPTTQEATMQDTVEAARHGTRRYQLIVADHLPIGTTMKDRACIDNVQPYFSTQPYYKRIGQSFLMLAQLSALKNYIRNNGIDLGTSADTEVVYPFTNAEYREAQLVLDGFADALGAAITKRLNNGEDVDDLYPLANVVQAIVNPLVLAITDAVRDTNSYDGSRYLQDMRSKLRTLVSDTLDDVCSKSNTGYVRAYYELNYGRLAYPATNDMRLSAIRSVISSLLNYEDSDDVEELLHDNDFNTCSDCGEWEMRDEMQTPAFDDSSDVCRTCIDQNYVYSDYSEGYIHRDDACTALNRHGERITIHCDEDDFYYDDEEDCRVHHDYSPPSRVLRRYHTAKNNDDYSAVISEWTKQNDRFFGIELEVECRKGHPGDYVDKLNDALNDGDAGARCFFEEDGSLSNGFEIITQPMGLDTHYQFWEWLQDKSLTANLRSHDTSTCGLHVHVNRNNLNRLQINKMCVFIHSPDNRNLIKAIARRHGVGYASMHAKKLGTAHEPSRSDPRYEAVNLTNRRTIEMRIFKGTLKHDSLLAALEFTHALVKFTAPASQAGFVLTTDKFMDFINADVMKPETRYLRNYLTAVGFTA